MNPGLKDILSESNKDIDNQKLMDYLSGKLSKDQLHEVEKQMADSPFMNDALEGLESIKKEKDINSYVEELNNELHNLLAKKKIRQQKHKLKDPSWIYLAIVIILLLLVICFVVVYKFL